MDWNQIDYIVQNPTVFVRQPTGGVAHVTIGFPGNISPYQGMNAAGITVATNRVLRHLRARAGERSQRRPARGRDPRTRALPFRRAHDGDDDADARALDHGGL